MKNHFVSIEQLSETPQQQYVRESLTRALKGVEEAKRTGKKLRSVDEFIAELDSEEIEQTANDMSFFDRFDNDWSDDPRDSHEIADELHNARVNDRSTEENVIGITFSSLLQHFLVQFINP